MIFLGILGCMVALILLAVLIEEAGGTDLFTACVLASVQSVLALLLMWSMP